ncbi:hypothetical protein ACHAW6_000810 [Cyclotella cf. meneghiniana]
MEQATAIDSQALRSPGTNGWTTLPSGTAGNPLTSQTNAMDAAPGSCWNMDSAAREAVSLAFATTTYAMSGPTYAALLSPTHQL